jgi:hypothetical protein
MASGRYPLSRAEGAGAILARISNDLRALLNTRGDDRHANVPNCLPAAEDNTEFDNAARDGGYEAKLELSHHLIEECLSRPAVLVSVTGKTLAQLIEASQRVLVLNVKAEVVLDDELQTYSYSYPFDGGSV